MLVLQLKAQEWALDGNSCPSVPPCLFPLLFDFFMNLPNKLTVARFVLTAVFVVMTADPGGWGRGWCFTAGLAVFVVASITDWLDGYWARKYNLVTNFGKLMDPLVDKVLMCGAFVMLTETPGDLIATVGHPAKPGAGVLPGWFTIAVLAREFLVTGLRGLASTSGVVIAADKLGKHKTTWQIILASYFLTCLATREGALQWLRPLFDQVWFAPHTMGVCLIWTALGFTLWSGWVYFWKNREIVTRDW